jgi:ribosome-binding ATPase YchF (GTP1/OBG family)
MKIFNFGLDITPGKYKYKGEYFDKLVEKFSPQKQTPYTVEFINDEIERSEAVVFENSKRLDFILIDLEKIEKRLQRCEDESEKELLKKAQKSLEEEKLLCDVEFSDKEQNSFKLLQLVTIKPSIGKERADDTEGLIKEIIDKSGLLLFFTVGKKEVRAWSLTKGEPVLEAAGKIHSDLKRGFIKADVVNCKDLDSFFNMAEARSKGLVQTVDRDYIVQANDIVEIKFNV